VKQILIALRFCHQKGFVHKAINPEHVMILKLAKSKSYLVKLVGFGRALKNGTNRLHKSIVRQDPIFDPP
jgi:serine/threonine protein kinase